jgi:predicted nucleic acid-binding protein
MESLILDASVLIALLDTADAHHERASVTARRQTRSVAR